MIYRRNSPGKQKRFAKLRRPLPLAIGAVVLVVLIVLALELTNTTHFFHKKTATSGTIPSTSSTNSSNDEASGDSNSTSSSSSSSSSTPTESPKSPGTPTSSGEPPRTPSGNFVSNHHPSLSDTEDAPSKVQSVCNTTPGATCKITFTSNGVTKTLEAKTANSDGIVIWDWDVKTAGFVEGSWQITASATLNGQTKTANDSQNLEVKP